MFDYPPAVATKVILPFERKDLRLGGQSFFVGQRGWLSLLEELTQDYDTIHRDAALLQDLNELPSLDPFLLKEHLNRRGYVIAPAYFAISDADMQRMQTFVGTQIQGLIELAFPNHTSNASQHKMAGVILSTTIDDRLEPLRQVMRLDAESYREGIFSWKGFLYYKWALNDLIPRLSDVLDEVPLLKSSTFIDNERAAADATQHLIDLGHRRIAHIAGDPAFAASARRTTPPAAEVVAGGCTDMVTWGVAPAGIRSRGAPSTATAWE